MAEEARAASSVGADEKSALAAISGIDQGYANKPIMLTRKYPGYALYSLIVVLFPLVFGALYATGVGLVLAYWVFAVSAEYVRDGVPFAVERWKVAFWRRPSRFSPSDL